MANLEALLHRKTAEAVERTRSKHREHVEFRVEEGNHGDDLMTPPELLLQRALKEANQLTREKEGELAVDQWVRAAALSRITHGESHWEFTRCHIQLGKAYLELRDLPKQALAHATKGCDLLLAPGVMSHDPPPEAIHSLATAHCTVGQVLTIQGQLMDAERSLLKAKQVSEHYSKVPHGGGPDLNLDLDIVSAMGRLCVKQTKYGKAKDHFAKAVELARVLHGAKDKSLIPILKLQSQAELEGGMYSKAIVMLEEALEIAEISDGLESELVAGVLVSLAHVHEANSEPDAVESLFQRAHEIFYATVGEDHPRALSCKEEFCRFLILRPNSREVKV